MLTSISQVQYANKNKLPFLLQNQGNGWADTFNLGNCGILINVAGLNKITFNEDVTQATIQGGTLTNDMIEAAYGNNTRFANPTCTCLGFLGFALGGGLTREMGLYGTGVDQIISVNLVLASGEAVYVDATHKPDLFYAIRGAGANFGIVTSAVVKAYPVPKAQNVAWEGALTYTDDKLEALMQAILDLDLEPHMEIDILFSTAQNKTSITAIPFYLGDAADAEKAFASILSLGPISNTATETPYNHWGDFAASFCIKGQRKPVYGASIARSGLNPKTWRAVYTEYQAFIAKYPNANASTVLAEYYPVQKAVTLGRDTSSYPFRDVPIHVVAIPQYDDENLDAVATAWGSRVRDLLRSTDGLVRNST